MSSFGLNCRSSSGYATDPAGTTYLLNSDSYPTTRGGGTFGWVDAPGGAQDVDNSGDARLAGNNYVQNLASNSKRLQIDLTGSMTVNIAAGKQGTGFNQIVSIEDSGGVKTSFEQATSADEFVDATGVVRTSAADWVSNQAATAAYTFADYVLVRIGNTAGGDHASFTTLNHVNLNASGGGGTVVPALDGEMLVGGMLQMSGGL